MYGHFAGRRLPDNEKPHYKFLQITAVNGDQEGTARYKVKAVEHFHPYLYGRRFLLRADHASLTWLLHFKNPEGQIARWIQRLQEYDVEIHHRKGSAHGNQTLFREDPVLRYHSGIEKKFGVKDPIVHQVTVPLTSALDPWSDENVRKDQLADPEIKPIIEFKESSDEKPSWQDIASFHPTTKRYWALWGLGSLGLSPSEKWCFISKMGV
ncbi:retrovirus-related Pol polyprotein from transposon 412 [Trichonephila clavipes]|nr:retrovirus-related Pol polyprotein from transposon 412 [Trichonephila clavipes]